MCKQAEVKADLSAEKPAEIKDFSKDEISKHSKWKGEDKDSWLVYRGKVYDISNFIKKHPGGNAIVLYAGQDATTVIERFHKDEKTLEKWLKPLYIGECKSLAKPPAIIEDFNKLTAELFEKGYFSSNKFFYLGMFAHIVALELLGQWFVASGGLEWGGMVGYWGLALVLATAQAQSGWLQHDMGHLSVFDNYWYNYFGHQVTISHLKAASKWWWTSRHQRHHAKPNVLKKDPDIDAPLPVFVFDTAWFDATRYYLRWTVPIQKYLWFLIGPPTVTTLLFVFQNVYYVIARRRMWDMFWISTYFARFYFQYASYVGGVPGLIKLYFATRIIETHWFTWVTSMNHLPMPMSKDQEMDWVTLQVSTTQNSPPGWFNDWFTGHLNYQIEHHLWPTMPRHNYYKAHFRVKELCEKHGLEYRVHSMYQSCKDIVNKLGSVTDEYFVRIQQQEAEKKKL